MSPRLEFALDAVYLAGRGTLAHFHGATPVELKADETPVTAADREVEATLRRVIERKFPGEAILGEEEGETGSGSSRWVLDPIDGTKSFICGVPLYATLLSYEVDCVPVLGVCYFPALDEMLYAERGQGAWWNGRRCQVSDQTALSRATLATGSLQSLENYGRLPGVVALGKRALAVRTWSDAYGHGLVATGRVEAMLDPIVNRWDISAMQVIVEEAGGTWSDFSGRAGLAEEAVSSNGRFHETLLEAFR